MDNHNNFHPSDIDVDSNDEDDDDDDKSDKDDDDDNDADVSSSVSIVSDSNSDSSVSVSIASDTTTMDTEEIISKNDEEEEEEDDSDDEGNDSVGGGEVAVIQKFNKLMGKQDDKEGDGDTSDADDDDEDDDHDFLRGLGGDGNEGDDSSCGSISDDQEAQAELSDLLEAEDTLTGDHKRRRGSSIDLEDKLLGPPIVVPLKTGSDHGDDIMDVNDIVDIDTNQRGSTIAATARRTQREGSFRRRPPQRTKSGDGITNNDDCTTVAEVAATKTRNGEGVSTLDNKDNDNNNDNDNDNGEESIQKTQPRRRRPPQRTKSGDCVAMPIQRRPPQRTKSGEGLSFSNRRDNTSSKCSTDDNENDNENDEDNAEYDDDDDDEEEEEEESLAPDEYVVMLPPSSDDDNDDNSTDDCASSNGKNSNNIDDVADIVGSPSGKQRRERRDKNEYREIALKRNAARRQKSSDMLGAMQQATMRAPARSQSSMAAFRRRKPPLRTKSGDGLVTPGGDANGNNDPNNFTATDVVSPRRPARRRPPQRTKSSDGLTSTEIDNTTSRLSSLRTTREKTSPPQFTTSPPEIPPLQRL